MIGAQAEEIIFTSGATEANNLAFAGLARHLRAAGRMHIITCAVEHSSVLAPLKALGGEGFRVSVLPVKPCGMIEAEAIEKALTPQTGLVSIQAVNNETGTIQPLAEIAEVLRDYGILFHSDAAQAPGRTPFGVAAAGVDFASFSAHKIYGPQGIGALYARAEKRALLSPLHHGGGQEGGLRAGTLPTALCAGFGAAAELVVDERARMRALRERFLGRIAALRPEVHGHKEPEWNAPGILNLRFPGIDNETLVMALPALAVGTGAACSSAAYKHSHVIHAMTGSEQAAREAVRLSFGRFTTEQDMDIAAEEFSAAVTAIRKTMEAA
jgi:cysteine desulfurase